MQKFTSRFHFMAFGAFCAAASPLMAQTFTPGQQIFGGAVCAGTGCLSTHSFSGAELTLQASNIQIDLVDDTISNGFPTNDWRIATNANFNPNFVVVDMDAQTIPFVIDGAAPDDALVVSGEGLIGMGLPVPEQPLHIRKGDTPTVRLDQDGSSGFEPFAWDVGGNDSNFFVRDVNGDTLPLRIRPGAPENSFYIASNGEIGMGIPDPRGALHIRRNQPNNVPHLIVQTRRTDGRAEIWFEDDQTAAANDALRLQLNGDVFNVSFNGTGGAELAITKTGDVRVPRGNLVVPTGGVIVGGQSLNVPDYVFADDYPLMPLRDVERFIAEHSHLPYIPSAGEVRENGLDMTEMMLALVRTVEELTLHTLAQQAEIEALKAR